MSIPHFKFDLAAPYSSQMGYIMLGHEKVHLVEDVHLFYEALGYTDEIKQLGILPEEFIWNEYHKAGSKKTDLCLQVKIIDYLSKHSATFKEKYAAQCKSWQALCLEKWANNTDVCKDCNEPQKFINSSIESP